MQEALLQADRAELARKSTDRRVPFATDSTERETEVSRACESCVAIPSRFDLILSERASAIRLTSVCSCPSNPNPQSEIKPLESQLLKLNLEKQQLDGEYQRLHPKVRSLGSVMFVSTPASATTAAHSPYF